MDVNHHFKFVHKENMPYHNSELWGVAQPLWLPTTVPTTVAGSSNYVLQRKAMVT